MSQLKSPLEEEFKAIDGYEGQYEVSNYGRVVNINYRGTGKRRLMSPGKVKSGYLLVKLYKEGKVKNFYVHRLVATAFLTNDENLPQVDHENGERDDNHVNNLCWCTAKENQNFPLARANKSKPRSDEARVNMSKTQKGENNPMYNPNSIVQIWKRVKKAGEYPYVQRTFNKVFKNPNHKDHQLVLNLIQKHTI